MSIAFTILMPCRNEADTIVSCIQEAKEALQLVETPSEVLICDNGSTDDSVALAQAAGARVVQHLQPGYGGTLLAGIKAARGTYLVMADSDGSYDFSQAPVFLKRLRDGDDLVVGNRFLGGIRPGAMPWLNRYVGNPFLSGLGRILFGSPIRDFHCGLRGFRVAAIRSLGLNSRGMEFASEMIIRAVQAGLKMSEIPTCLRPDGRSGRPHLRPWKDGWRHLALMFRLRIHFAARR